MNIFIFATLRICMRGRCAGRVKFACEFCEFVEMLVYDRSPQLSTPPVVFFFFREIVAIYFH